MAIPNGYGGRDYPDFGVNRTGGRYYKLEDMSELAVRLGSLSWFDRVGSVLLIEGFENGLGNWGSDLYSEGGMALPSAEYYSSVPFSAQLITTITPNSLAGINRGFPFPFLPNCGVEFHFKSVVPFKYLDCNLIFYDGTYSYTATIRINYADDRIDLMYETDVYEDVGVLNLSIGTSAPFHVLKSVMDLTNENYVRIILNDRDIDVTDVPIIKDVDDTEPKLYFELLLTPVSETVNSVWIDNLIFTVDEPIV